MKRLFVLTVNLFCAASDKIIYFDLKTSVFQQFFLFDNQYRTMKRVWGPYIFRIVDINERKLLITGFFYFPLNMVGCWYWFDLRSKAHTTVRMFKSFNANYRQIWFESHVESKIRIHYKNYCMKKFILVSCFWSNLFTIYRLFFLQTTIKNWSIWLQMITNNHLFSEHDYTRIYMYFSVRFISACVIMHYKTETRKLYYYYYYCYHYKKGMHFIKDPFTENNVTLIWPNSVSGGELVRPSIFIIDFVDGEWWTFNAHFGVFPSFGLNVYLFSIFGPMNSMY